MHMPYPKERKTVLKRRDYRFAYPEFLPDCDRRLRNHTRELLERRDMLARRENTMIPEFYVGSIVAVTISLPPEQSPTKESTFVGIVIDRGGIRGPCPSYIYVLLEKKGNFLLTF